MNKKIGKNKKALRRRVNKIKNDSKVKKEVQTQSKSDKKQLIERLKSLGYW